MPLSDTEPLVVHLFNVFQVGIDSGMLWNTHVDRALSLLDIHRSMSDLAVHTRVIDNELVLSLVSTYDCIISTKSERLRVKVVDHLKNYFP